MAKESLLMKSFCKSSEARGRGRARWSAISGAQCATDYAGYRSSDLQRAVRRPMPLNASACVSDHHKPTFGRTFSDIAGAMLNVIWNVRAGP